MQDVPQQEDGEGGAMGVKPPPRSKMACELEVGDVVMLDGSTCAVGSPRP